MNNDLISRTELKKCAIPCQIHNGALTELCVPLYQIDYAPAVEPFEPDYVGAERLKARQRGYEQGYHFGMEIGKTLNPKIKQGEWIVVGRAAYGYVDIECPCCKYLREDVQADNKPNFCENCGAKMQKGGKEE